MSAKTRRTQSRHLPAIVTLLLLATTTFVAAQLRSADPRELLSTENTPTPAPISALVTGDPSHLQNAVAAGDATAEILLTPVAFHPGGFYGQGDFYTYADINGQRLTVSSGGGRTFWNMQLRNWGPAKLRSWVGRVDANTFLGANADCGGGPGSCTGASDLLSANQTCSTTPDCWQAFGEDASEGTCHNGVCDYAWVDYTRADYWRPIAGFCPFSRCGGACGVADPSGAICFDAAEDVYGSRVDDGQTYYGATLALDVPIDAKGIYTIGWIPEDTSFGDNSLPQNEIPLAALVPGELYIPIGSCCTNLGLSTFTCIDNTTQDECEIGSNAPFKWRLEQACPEACQDCEKDAHCVTEDACTIGSCFVFVCEHRPIDNWDPQTQCCNPITAELTDIPHHDVCIEATCSSEGQPILTPRPVGLPCVLDDNCIVNSKCSTDGRCLGTPDIGSACTKPRFISFTPIDNGGDPSLIQVRLVSLHRPNPPNSPAVETKDFSAFEGQFRFVGAPFDCVDSPSLGTVLKCTMLTCTPVAVDWTAEIGDQTLHITGDAIVPSSIYDIEQWPELGIPEDPPLRAENGVRTARWGDVGAPYQDPSSPMRSQPNIADVVFTVDKVKSLPTALSKPRVLLRGNIPNPNLNVSSSDIVLAIDAIKGFGFPFDGPSPCDP